LAVLAIDVGRAERRAGNQGTDQAMRMVREGLVKLSQDVHSLSHRLHPSILDDLGLVDALKTECDSLSNLARVPIGVKIQENFAAPTGQIALCLFRVTQEALQNVSRHAKASSVDVSLRELDDGFELSVRDDGVGFDGHRREQPSLGLASMRERVYQLGGKLDIDSAPGRGTTVSAWVPRKENRHESPASAAG
jgi:signal transduction histidine kinase